MAVPVHACLGEPWHLPHAATHIRSVDCVCHSRAAGGGRISARTFGASCDLCVCPDEGAQPLSHLSATRHRASYRGHAEPAHRGTFIAGRRCLRSRRLTLSSLPPLPARHRHDPPSISAQAPLAVFARECVERRPAADRDRPRCRILQSQSFHQLIPQRIHSHPVGSSSRLLGCPEPSNFLIAAILPIPIRRGLCRCAFPRLYLCFTLPSQLSVADPMARAPRPNPRWRQASPSCKPTTTPEQSQSSRKLSNANRRTDALGAISA